MKIDQILEKITTRKKLAIAACFVLSASALFCFYGMSINALSSTRNVFLTASHEAGHCLLDEKIFPNSVKSVELTASSFFNVIKYLLIKERPGISISLPGRTECIKNVAVQDVTYFLNEATCLLAGSEATNMMMKEKYVDMTIQEEAQLVADIYAGAEGDRKAAEAYILKAMKVMEKLDNSINSITQITDDEQGTLYLILYDECLSKARTALIENREQLRQLSEELADKRYLSGKQVGKILKEE